MVDVRWLPVPSFEGVYSVSDQGDIRRDLMRQGAATDRFMSPRLSWNGYLQVRLSDRNHRAMSYVHRLVLLAFSGEPQDGQECRHLNGVKTDNRLANLEWGSRQENMDDSVRLGLTASGKDHHNVSITPLMVRAMRELHRQGVKQTRLIAMFGMSQSHTSAICRRKYWSNLPDEESVAWPISG
jgi:hypothetical protein